MGTKLGSRRAARVALACGLAAMMSMATACAPSPLEGSGDDFSTDLLAYGYQVIDDTTIAAWYTYGACTREHHAEVSENTNAVTITVPALMSSGPCTAEGYETSAVLELAAPLGDRAVIDGNGNPIPEVDDAGIPLT